MPGSCFDIEAELKTLYDELRQAYKRLISCGDEEAETVIRRQIGQIKRDIRRNSMKLQDVRKNMML